MSAVPNLPQDVISSQTDNADAAFRHLQKSKEHASHVERVEIVNGATTNGHAEHGRHASVPTRKDSQTGIPFQIHDTPVENQRPIKVIVIGAGYSGIYAGIRIPERIRNCELVIYEKNDGVGGTWYENRYPGAACDIPSHSYQFSFNPKHDWSSLYAPSWEIRDYIEQTAKKYGADRFIKLRHEVKGCTWDQDQGKWHVRIQRPTGQIFEDTCDVLISARGLLNTKQWPSIPGLDSFKGEVMHSAAWNESYDFANKRIGIIGSGSSAIQIVPKLQALSHTKLSLFIRSRTWISPPFGEAAMADMGMTDDLKFLPEQIETFAKDPEAWRRFRLKVEADANNIHASTLKGSEMQVAAEKAFDEGMKQRLKRKPEYYDWLKPSFAPGCRRLTPGPGFLEALVEDNVSFIRSEITAIEPDGVRTADGQLHALDVLVCATGFYASAAPPFAVTGLDGRTMQQHWHDRATNYLSLTTDGFPNHFFMLGPNGAIGEGSLTMMIESTGDYLLKAIRKIQKENVKAMVVRPRAVKDFMRYCDAYFAGTVYMDDCRSWYRKNGQGQPSDHITGLWPGSTLHCIEALRSPRWEDFDYEYWPEANGAEVNCLGWLGNGWGVKQLGKDLSEEALAWYLLPEMQERYLGVPEKGRPEGKWEYEVRPWSH